MHQVTLPVEIPHFFLSQIQPQCSRNTSTRLKSPFLLSLPALHIHLQTQYSAWSHWRCFSNSMLPHILLSYLIPMSTLCNNMRYWSNTSRESFSTTPFPPLICPISIPIPPDFQHPSHMTFSHRGLPQFQLLLMSTLQVTCPQHFHIHLLQNSHIRSLSQIHPLLPDNIKEVSPQALHSHPQVWHTYQPQNIHLINMDLILHHPQFFLCLQIRVWYLALHHQICLFYFQPYFLLNYPDYKPLQALHPQV